MRQEFFGHMRAPIEGARPIDDETIRVFYRDLIAGLTPQTHPTLIAIGGAPGSGKSTYRKNNMGTLLCRFHLHDMDEVLVRLPGYHEDLAEHSATYAFEQWWPTAQRVANRICDFALAHRLNVLYDRTCGTDGSYFAMQRAKQEYGYTISLYGLFVEVDEAMRRVEERAKMETRVVPGAIVREYLARFSALWPHYVALADRCQLIDSNGGANNDVLIFHSLDGITDTLDPIRYEQFLAPGKDLVFRVFFPDLDAQAEQTNKEMPEESYPRP